VANVLAGMLISADLCRMSKAVGPHIGVSVRICPPCAVNLLQLIKGQNMLCLCSDSARLLHARIAAACAVNLSRHAPECRECLGNRDSRSAICIFEMPSLNRCTLCRDSAPTARIHAPCAGILCRLRNGECLSSRVHFCRFVSNVSGGGGTCRCKGTKTQSNSNSNSISNSINNSNSNSDNEFLPMSQLACSFLMQL